MRTPILPEALIGDVLTTFMAWAAHQELEAVSQENSRQASRKPGADGKVLGRPRKAEAGDQVEEMARLKRSGLGLRAIGRRFGVSADTVMRRLRDYEDG